MKTVILLLLASAISHSQFALAHQSVLDSACFRDFSAVQKWTQFTPTQIKCMNESQEFNQSMSFFCSPDQSQLSLKYLKFLELEEKYHNAWKSYRAAKPEDKPIAFVEMQNAKFDMDTFGNAGVYQNLNSVLQVTSNCTQQ